MEEIYKEKAKLRSFNNLKNVKENISTAPNDAIEFNKGICHICNASTNIVCINCSNNNNEI